MEKPWYKSKTIWGGLLLAIEATLQSLDTSLNVPWLKAGLYGLGTFLTIFGFRAALPYLQNGEKNAQLTWVNNDDK